MSFAGRPVARALSRARPAAALVALAAAMLGRPDPASACSCPERAPAEIIATSDAIFRGTVTHFRRTVVPYLRPDGSLSGHDFAWLVRFAVERTWKGAETEEVSVMILAEGSACGTDSVEIGEPWRVFAWEYAGGLATNRCAARGMEEHDFTELLGDGEAPSEPGRGPEPRAGAPFPNRPPLVRPTRGCACETALGGASSQSSAPGGWGLLAAALVLIGARRRVRGGGRVKSCFQPDR